jgi:hypothetical protein
VIEQADGMDNFARCTISLHTEPERPPSVRLGKRRCATLMKSRMAAPVGEVTMLIFLGNNGQHRFMLYIKHAFIRKRRFSFSKAI